MYFIFVTFLESTSENLWKELELAKTDFKEAESAILRKHKELRRKEHEFQPSGVRHQYIESQTFTVSVSEYFPAGDSFSYDI